MSAANLIDATTYARQFLHAVGFDTTSPGLERTPERFASAYVEWLRQAPFEATTFPNESRYNEMVIVKDIPFTSICEHHALPFYGSAIVGYLPGEEILGLSKIVRAVQSCAARPQIQERLTTHIRDWVMETARSAGVAVILSARHSCMTLRGAKADSTTVTSSVDGRIRDDERTRGEFYALASLALK